MLPILSFPFYRRRCILSLLVVFLVFVFALFREPLTICPLLSPHILQHSLLWFVLYFFRSYLALIKKNPACIILIPESHEASFKRKTTILKIPASKSCSRCSSWLVTDLTHSREKVWPCFSDYTTFGSCMSLHWKWLELCNGKCWKQWWHVQCWSTSWGSKKLQGNHEA